MFIFYAIDLLILILISEFKVLSSVQDVKLFISSQRSLLSKLENFILEEQDRIKYLTLYGNIFFLLHESINKLYLYFNYFTFALFIV